MAGWNVVSDQKSEAGEWVVANSTGEELATGQGMGGFIAAFEEDKVLFGAYRCHGVDEQENVASVRPKICRVNWVGAKVPMMKKMQALQGKAKISDIWSGTAIEVDANKPEEITAQAMGKALLACGGAHKPTHYDFGGDDKIPLADLYNE
eukprot:CAMPEP_0205808620 /NCGR_PEP_ID=MMETSP0205-20121125/12615_1 /ASSEMBLY_ACC=CAM_ASM_000278 /TAXON_ID=36767 /ORGANISM="Euplotes focardii, Strain TN1" /LENGTH=149 /DNA_ID=CAMNT_0053084563 /DNA_START=37 /DNA_END=486 /DNA_ORIENTATION=-